MEHMPIAFFCSLYGKDSSTVVQLHDEPLLLLQQLWSNHLNNLLEFAKGSSRQVLLILFSEKPLCFFIYFFPYPPVRGAGLAEPPVIIFN